MAPFGIDIPSIKSLKSSVLSGLTSALPGEAKAAADKAGAVAPSGWRASLKPASFRGVAFFVDQRELEGGRRAVTHEFPGRDIPFTEDLGRKAATFTVEGYVLGADYMAARDKFEAACNAEGPGALIVPWMPERKVVCTGMRLRETAKEGGIARFSLTFTEAGQESTPTGAPLPGVLADTKADDMFGVLGDVLNSSINIAGVPLPVAAETLQAIQELGEQISGVASIAALAADIPGALKSLTNISLADFTGLLPSELLSPFFQLSDSFSLLRGAYGSLSWIPSLFGSTSRRSNSTALTSRVSGLLTLASAAPVITVPAGAGTVRSNIAANRAAIAEYQRAAAVTEAARTVAMVQPASRQEAATLRTQIVEAIDQVLDTTTNADVYTRLIDLRTSTVKALAESAGTVPEVTTVRSLAVQPALALAQRFVVSPGYGTDATEAETEILARNRVRHPGFVPPGQLEVLRAL